MISDDKSAIFTLLDLVKKGVIVDIKKYKDVIQFRFLATIKGKSHGQIISLPIEELEDEYAEELLDGTFNRMTIRFFAVIDSRKRSTQITITNPELQSPATEAIVIQHLLRIKELFEQTIKEKS